MEPFGATASYIKHRCHPYFPKLMEAARAAGLDTLQFMTHNDQNCGNMALEIVDIRNGTSTCPGGTPLRRGWRASEPCECQRLQGCITCNANATSELDRYPPAWHLYPSRENASQLAWGGYMEPYSHHVG